MQLVLNFSWLYIYIRREKAKESKRKEEGGVTLSCGVSLILMQPCFCCTWHSAGAFRRCASTAHVGSCVRRVAAWRLAWPWFVIVVSTSRPHFWLVRQWNSGLIVCLWIIKIFIYKAFLARHQKKAYTRPKSCSQTCAKVLAAFAFYLALHSPPQFLVPIEFLF